MIKLGLLFQSGMIFQCEKSVAIWGTSDKAQRVSAFLNGSKIIEWEIPQGSFEVILPPQKAIENATLQIGDITLKNVDFGEVWIAGGQSNMQFYVKWDAEREAIYSQAHDEHLRYFEVAKYTFDGEDKDGFKDASRWDRWLSFDRENCPYFSAAATFFALELRKKLKVPIGIVSCSFGGTSASAWMDEKILREDEELKIYTDEYDRSLEGLDLQRYYTISRYIRKNMGNDEKSEDFLHRNEGVTVEQFYGFMADRGVFSDKETPEQFSAEEMSRPGPNEPHPGALYRSMLQKIIGFTAKGVIWYQGCSDESKSMLYKKLFTKLIENWRTAWKEELPFIFAQLAPFSSWFGNTGANFPAVRKSQESVQKSVANTYMISTADIGCEKDIHPKYKSKIGMRMALQALDKIYAQHTLADSPQYCGYKWNGDTLILQFQYGDGLTIVGDTVKALEVFSDGKTAIPYSVEISDSCLKISSKEFKKFNVISVRYAQTPYYKVNLFNRAGLPAFPFEAEIKRQENMSTTHHLKVMGS